MKRILITLLALSSYALQLNAQTDTVLYLKNSTQFITSNFNIDDYSGWITTKSNSNLNPLNFFNLNKLEFNISLNNDLKIINSNQDNQEYITAENRQKHDKYQQTHGNLDIEYAESIIHSKGNKIVSINTKIVPNFNNNCTPVVTEQIALANAINHLSNNNLYAWQNAEAEQELKVDANNPNATYYPRGKLLHCNISTENSLNSISYKLAYKFAIKCLNPQFSKIVYIDAFSGFFLKEINLEFEDGPAALMHYGSKTIDTKQRNYWPYNDSYLSAEGNGRNIFTKKVGNTPAFNLWSKVTDGDDNWPQSDEKQTTPHFCATVAWDYFKNKHNQNGCDNGGGELRMITSAPDDKAFYTSGSNWGTQVDEISIGGINVPYKGVIDIVGHEFTHGVIGANSALLPVGESGSLGESFGDIFGAMIEIEMQNGVINDWTIGEDAMTTRNMKQPSLSPKASCNGIQGQPSIYLGARWDANNCPNSFGKDIHHNSSVQSYWFYLLSMGSVGAPDGTNANITVNGIGVNKASQIAFHNMKNNLTQNSNYIDARNGSIASAKAIFGSCSNEVIQTKNAWAAVGIGLQGSIVISAPTFTSLTLGSAVQNLPITIVATDYGLQNSNFTWTTSSNITGNSLGYFNNYFKITGISTSNSQLAYSNTWLNVSNSCQSLTYKIIVIPFITGPVSGTGTGGGKSQRMSTIVSPNPTNGIVRIESFIEDDENNNSLWNYAVLNCNGNVIQNGVDLQELPDSLDLRYLNAGIYYILTSKGDNFNSIKLIIE